MIDLEVSDIPSLAKGVLQDALDMLIVEKAIKDKEFSQYLDSNFMSIENLDTPEWKTYQSMLKDYEKIERLTTTTKYYLGMYNGNI